MGINNQYSLITPNVSGLYSQIKRHLIKEADNTMDVFINCTCDRQIISKIHKVLKTTGYQENKQFN